MQGGVKYVTAPDITEGEYVVVYAVDKRGDIAHYAFAMHYSGCWMRRLRRGSSIGLSNNVGYKKLVFN